MTEPAETVPDEGESEGEVHDIAADGAESPTEDVEPASEDGDSTPEESGEPEEPGESSESGDDAVADTAEAPEPEHSDPEDRHDDRPTKSTPTARISRLRPDAAARAAASG